MIQWWYNHDTVYYSTPVTDLADMFVLVCSVRYSVTPTLMGGHIWTWPSAYGEGHGKKKRMELNKFVQSSMKSINGIFLIIFTDESIGIPDLLCTCFYIFLAFVVPTKLLKIFFSIPLYFKRFGNSLLQKWIFHTNKKSYQYNKHIFLLLLYLKSKN